MAAWEDYSQETLDKMWEYWVYCLQSAIDYNGGNNYPSHRSEEDQERAAKKQKRLCV